MTTRCNLRSLDAVVQLTREDEDTVEPQDNPSDEENFTEEESDTESEQSAGSENEEIEAENEEVESEESDDDDSDTAPAAKKPRNTEGRGGRGANSESQQNPTTSGSSRGRRKSTVTGKNGHKWYTTPRQRLSTRGPVVSTFATPIGRGKGVRTPYESWSLYFDEAILLKIVQHTNEEIDRYTEDREINRRLDSLYKHIDLIELKAFIGLLYFSGLQKTNMTSLYDLWDIKVGCIRYRAVMSQRRFEAIKQFLRFDDKNTRAVRRAKDKFAPIREIWDTFIEKCRTLYRPAKYCTIDVQLLSFRGRCPFKVYNGQKPGKYGVKIVNLNDSKTFYMVNAIPYVGKLLLDDKSEKVPSYYVRKLSEPIYESNRNITCDNWFSSTEIFDKMLDKDLTMVGTLKKNEPQIPPSFKNAGEVGSSKFAFDQTKTLVSFIPKKKNVVLVLSTLHRLQEIDQNTNKPEMVRFYKMTKGGTDTFDQMCHEYTTARKTKRWPMRVFMGMLDQSGINSSIIYNFNAQNEPLTRREFLKSLINDLTIPHIRRRKELTNLPRQTSFCIQEILDEGPIRRPTTGRARQGRCVHCPRTFDRKYGVKCSRCNAHVCPEHRAVLCQTCGEQ